MHEDEKIGLNSLFHYMNKVFKIGEKLVSLKDTRQRRGIVVQTAISIVLVGFIMQKPSFNSIFNQASFKRRIKNLFTNSTKIPGLDAAREIIEMVDTDELKKINEDIVEKARSNKVFRKGTIDGLVVAAIDGVELYSSYNKCCENCLERKHQKNGEEQIEYFHKAVVCMTVGSDPHVILGEEMLCPRDGNQKDEGELTGGTRLINSLYKNHSHFADVIVADALYLKAPFIETVTGKNIDVVIRAKDKTRIILQDALGLVKKEASSMSFKEKKINIKVWDIKGFTMESVKKPLRFLQFEETRIKKKAVITRNKGEKKTEKTFVEVEERVLVWVFTTLDVSPQTIWRIIHARWDIEDNGFHQLKTYYHIDHCFDHKATENVFLLNILAFNIRELFLYRRLRKFRESKQTRVDKTNEWLDDLLQYKFYEYFRFDSG